MSPEHLENSVYPGVAQLVGRLVWDQDAASSSLATRTMKNGCFREKTTVFLACLGNFESADYVQMEVRWFIFRYFR